jgi:hypothetical protein
MMNRWLQAVSLVGITALGCAQAQADEESLRNSFAERIASSAFVSDFERDGPELRFSGPDGEGNTTDWVVRIETSFVEPNEFDDASPFVGRILSEWEQDGDVAEFLGNMTAIPQEFLDRGLAQECWANWIEVNRAWDW